MKHHLKHMAIAAGLVLAALLLVRVDLRTALRYALLLACPLGMVGMTLMMNRPRHRGHEPAGRGTTNEPGRDTTGGPSHDTTGGPSHDIPSEPGRDTTGGPCHDVPSERGPGAVADGHERRGGA